MTVPTGTTQTSPDPPTSNNGNNQDGWVVAALSDWVNLLSGPRSTTFSAIISSYDWNRLVRVVLLAVLFTLAISTGFSVGLQGKLDVSIVKDSLISGGTPAVFTVVIGALLAVAYTGVSRWFGIRLETREAFFITLLICVPWLPILVLIYSIRSLNFFPLQGIIWEGGTCAILITLAVQFTRAVYQRTSCASWKAVLSVTIPVSLILFLIIYLYFVK